MKLIQRTNPVVNKKHKLTGPQILLMVLLSKKNVISFYRNTKLLVGFLNQVFKKITLKRSMKQFSI